VKPFPRTCFGTLFVIVITVFAAAYDHPLDSYAIREAYFLGTDRSRSLQVLAQYTKTFQTSGSGPHVTQMEVRTPYVQVIVSSREHSVGYSAQQAEEDYRKNPNTLQVRVQILFTNAFANPLPVLPTPSCQGVNRMNSALDCFHDFRFHFNQAKALHASQSYGVPIYAPDSGILLGGDVWFTFPANGITSSPLKVTVSPADGHDVSATFDLATLR
jgi:hypothetical protein